MPPVRKAVLLPSAHVARELRRLIGAFTRIAAVAPEIRIDRHIGDSIVKGIELKVTGSLNCAMVSRFEALSLTASKLIDRWSPLSVSARVLAAAPRDRLFLAAMFELAPRHVEIPRVRPEHVHVSSLVEAPAAAVTSLEVLLAEASRQCDSEHDGSQAGAAAGSRDRLPIEETREVSLKYAAEKWFQCDRRTLKKAIENRARRARPLTRAKWIFDLGEVAAANPKAKNDADPEMYRKRKRPKRTSTVRRRTST